MFDPNQDRLMIQRMTYFRIKRLRLVSIEKWREVLKRVFRNPPRVHQAFHRRAVCGKHWTAWSMGGIE